MLLMQNNKNKQKKFYKQIKLEKKVVLKKQMTF